MTALETLKCYTHGKKNTDKVEISVLALNRIIKALSQEPLADYVKEHYASKESGKWIEQEGWDGDVYYECSICGEPFCLIDGTPTDNMYNYCPNCGAKMESEDV